MLAPFLILQATALLAFFLPVDAYPRLLPRQTNSTGTTCYQIFSSDYVLFLASDAYDCLITAPFNATVASGLVSYYKDLLQFQSTLAYLKDPPPSYQQPSIDVLASLDALEAQVQAGTFKTEYDFEVALQTVIYAIHDAHVSLSAGLLSIFTFGSPLRIVSVSSNGIELPKIYIPDDLIEAAQNNVTWTPSAVSSINGRDATEYLTQFAATNAAGTIEPNADWNQLMSNPAGDVLAELSAFEGSTIFYPGANISFVFENGTTYDDLPWLAGYSNFVDSNTPALSSGQDLYDYFVLGIFPTDIPTATSSDLSATATSTLAAAETSSTDSTSDSDSTITSTPTPSASASPSSWSYAPFPSNPIVAQPNLGLDNGGVLTGYFLNDGITAVLSIPSFEVTGEAVISFSTTIGDFISQAKAAGLTRIIIDLQRNMGGSEILAVDAFKQFFPSIDPSNGARLRANNFGDALGNTFTTYYNTQQLNESFYEALSADVEVAQILNSSITPLPQDSSDIDFYINYAQFNIKDSVRKGEDFPQQFGYEAADCRIFYTTWTVYNFENLWNYVIDAFFRNPELCINGAANLTSPVVGTNETGPTPKPAEIPTPTTPGGVADLILKGLQRSKRDSTEYSDHLAENAPLSPRSIPNPGSAHHLSTFIHDGRLNNVDTCTTCRNGEACTLVPSCSGGLVLQQSRRCVRTCSKNSKGICGSGATCHNNSFCLDLKSANNLRLCQTPTRDLKSQQTRAVAGNDVHLQYSRPGFGIRR